MTVPSQSSPSSNPIAKYSSPSGTFDFYNNDALALYFTQMQSSSEDKTSATAFLQQFKKLPNATNTMNLYCEEFLKCIDNKLLIAPSILIGALSELVILHLIESIGTFLEDTNALSNYFEKKGDAKIDYVTSLVNKVREKITKKRVLTTEESNQLRKYSEVAEHMFDSIRLNRNEYAHPKPDTSLDDLPDNDSFICRASAFNTYAKVILELNDYIHKLNPAEF